MREALKGFPLVTFFDFDQKFLCKTFKRPFARMYVVDVCMYVCRLWRKGEYSMQWQRFYLRRDPTSKRTCASFSVCVCVCVYVCVYMRERQTEPHTHTHLRLVLVLYVCVHVCVHERETDNRQTHTPAPCSRFVCVCTCVFT